MPFTAAKSACPLIAALIAGAALIAPAFADSYPVSGRWTFNDASGEGPTPACTGRIMTFSGNMRYDTGGGIHEYKNKTAGQVGDRLYQIVDTFYNGQTWGFANYQLRLPDSDHIEIDSAKDGSAKLRRCS
jgi:hypothetical protein